MLRYIDFTSDLLLEKLLLESIVYLSPDFVDNLKKIDSPISKELLDTQGVNIKNDLTFIDVDESEGYVSFKTMVNAKKSIVDEYPDHQPMNRMDVDYDNPLSNALYGVGSGVWKKSRNPIKIGRLINNMFPGKFNQREIEDFINRYKSIQTSFTMRVVDGDEIFKWYKKENYMNMKGTLGGSCMASGIKSWFNIYTKNPDVCKMLILVDNDNGNEKLLGRALLWKINNTKTTKFEWFLDRQYTGKDSDVIKMRNYAIEKGWAFKTNNNHHSFDEVTFDNKELSLGMSVKVGTYEGSYDYKEYPYLDTFRRYDPENGILHNDDDSEEGYLLHEVDGSYEDLNNTRVYSDYTGDYIDEDDAVWSEPLESYINSNVAVLVNYGDSRNYGWYPSEYDDIVFDGWIEKYIHVDDAIYSYKYGYDILSENAISVIFDGNINEDGSLKDNSEYYVHTDDDDFIHFSELDEFEWFIEMSSENNWGMYHQGISKNLLVKDHEGDWVLKYIQTKTYECEESIKGINWFSETDAKVLGLEINRSKERLEVTKDYNYKLKERGLVNALISGYNRLIKKEQLEIDFPYDILDKNGRLDFKSDIARSKDFDSKKEENNRLKKRKSELEGL